MIIVLCKSMRVSNSLAPETNNLTSQIQECGRDGQDEYFFHRRRGRCMNHGVERRQCRIAVLVVSVETAPIMMTEDLT